MTTLRNLVLATATAAAALAAGASASAQDFRRGGPSYGYGYEPAAYGYAGGYGRESRDALRDRIAGLERRIDWMTRGDRIAPERAWRLSADLRDLRRDLWRADGRDLNRIDDRLDRLEDRLSGRGYGERRW